MEFGIAFASKLAAAVAVEVVAAVVAAADVLAEMFNLSDILLDGVIIA